MRYLLLRLKRFCGFITGFIFLISGLFKLMDPVGAGLVMKEYYEFLHIGFLNFSAKPAGVLFALAESVIGAGLITGVWRKFVAMTAICIQAFFTLLTLLLVIFNPEMDCGCFGEAIHLTHMQTFVKNIVLMALLLIYYIPRKCLGETRKKKYISFALVSVSIAAFTVYSWIYIPLVDYTAYRPGAELNVGAVTDTDEMYESVFVYEKDGVQETFTLGHLPDDSWTFVSTHTRMVEGKEENLVGLSFYSMATGEYQDSLAIDGKVMVISVYDTEISERSWKKTSKFIERSRQAGFNTLLLCSSETGIPYNMQEQAYISDYKTLISLNRSNGGATYFNNGELIRKWADANYPDSKELTIVHDDDDTEISIEHESKGSLAFQGFLLYIFAVMLLL